MQLSYKTYTTDAEDELITLQMYHDLYFCDYPHLLPGRSENEIEYDEYDYCDKTTIVCVAQDGRNTVIGGTYGMSLTAQINRRMPKLGTEIQKCPSIAVDEFYYLALIVV